MRMHYACSPCRTQLEGSPTAVVEVVLYTDRPSPRELGKKCCFCQEFRGAPADIAQFRIRTDAPTNCPAGHLPPGKLEELAARAAEAAMEDVARDMAEESPAMGMGFGPELRIEKP